MKQQVNMTIRITIMLCVLIVTPLMANEDNVITERERLQNVLNELELLKQYVTDTQHIVTHNRTTRFNYQVLTDDLNIIKGAIERYLNQSTTKPNASKRVLEPLSGEYKT